MKTTILLLSVAALLSGCGEKHGTAQGAQPVTQTIAPAEAQPAPGSGTDALTQTVDVGSGRSEAEGGTVAAPAAATAGKPASAKKKPQHK